ncbi:condensation domain-containing protein [Pendulispora brunnea]|uniref:Condensation domain-containing protein n=1 Tax=Pendulispora brunnea TaxID=2905690 RepID=A0ABZ2KDJ6_9BACT
MRDWVDTTAARIRSLWKVPGRRPRMLELGCSSGPLLFRLAAHAETYHATDMSRAAVESLSRECNTMGFSHVTLAQREANDFKKLGMSAYDVIVLNSVVQYFPSIDYLVDVLEKASRALRPGGSLFIGNVRSLPLLELFHTSAELAKAPASRTVAQLKRRVRHAVAAENELVVDPAFFWELGRLLPRLAGLVCERILCQRTRSRDEASQFRYDVVLRHRAIDALPPAVDSLEWRAPFAAPAKEILQGLRERLEEERWPMLTLTHARDARLASELRAFELANEAEENCTVGDLRKALSDRDAPSTSALDPDDLFLVGNEFGYDVDVLGCGDAPGYFDVRFLRRTTPAPGGRDAERREERSSFAPPPVAEERPIHHYATKPHREVQPVSAMQAHMLERLETNPEPGLYTSFDVVPMPASVDRAIVERAWQTLVERHAALRTSFVKTLSGRYRQVVHESAKVPLEEHDWRHLPPLDVDRELEAYIDSFRARPFELDEYPPVRLALFRTRARSWVFLGFSHIALDGASTMILREQWLALYKAYSSGGSVPSFGSSPPLLRPPTSVDAASGESFWRRELQGFRRPMNLVESMGRAGDAPRGERSYAKQHVYLDKELSERLAAVSRAEKLSLHTLVHGAWALLLREYTDRQDVLFGTMVSPRTPIGPASEGTVGALDDVLPVRPPSPSRFLSLQAWLEALRDGLTKLPRHGHASLTDVKRWSELPASARLFESYVVVENRSIDENTSESLDPATPFSLVQLDCPLRVEAWPGPRLLLILQYHRRHFRDEAVEKMLRDMERVLGFLSHGLDRSSRG